MMMLGRLDFRCAPFSQIPFSAHRLAHPPVPLRLPHSSPLHQALFSEGQSPAKILVVSAVVITGLKLRFLIAPMRSYYLLIRSFWDQHQTDNNNKHSFLELSNDPACPAGLVAIKEHICNAGDPGLIPLAWRIPWTEEPSSPKESDTTETT